MGKFMKRKAKGFTLIELVVVIAIILILVAIAIPKFSKSNLSAQAATHNVNVKELKNSAILYTTENPESSGDITSNLGEYFDKGELPKPAKALNTDSFTVNYDGANVTVNPGEVKVEGDKLILVGGTN